MEINFMSWNTGLYMQCNCIAHKQKDIDDKKSREIIDVVKKHIDKINGVAILQEIPYRLNSNYKSLKKWAIHPAFSLIESTFPKSDYDILYDDSNDWRIIQTIVIAKKGLISPNQNKNKKTEKNNNFYNFKIGDLECLAVHSNNSFELREWIKSNYLFPKLIAGDFNAGNYILEDKEKDREISINRQNYLLLSEGYIDLFQGIFTTNYGDTTEPRQIDHVLVENSYIFKQKYDYKNVVVDTKICESDHFPLYWTLIKKS